MSGEVTEPRQCVDCGALAGHTTVRLHPGAVSTPSDEGHIRHTRVALCDACADKRVAVQEPNFV